MIPFDNDILTIIHSFLVHLDSIAYHLQECVVIVWIHFCVLLVVFAIFGSPVSLDDSLHSIVILLGSFDFVSYNTSPSYNDFVVTIST
jgi:hypothetical protein